MRAGLGPQARVCAEPNRKIRIWNDEGKSTFCEIGLQFRPPAIGSAGINLNTTWYKYLRTVSVIYCLFINYIKYK